MDKQKKLQIFLSSECTDDTLKIVREALRLLLEKTNLFDIYVYENESPTSLPNDDAFLMNLDESHLCLFFIDENVPLKGGVKKEFDRAMEIKKKCLFFFLNGENDSDAKKIIREKGFCKYYSVTSIKDFIGEGYNAVFNELLDIYRLYSRGGLIAKTDERQIDFTPVKDVDYKISNTFFKGFFQTYKYFNEYVLGANNIGFDEKDHTSSEFDNLAFRIFPTIIENGMLDVNALETLNHKLNDVYPLISDIRTKRFDIIKEYYSDNLVFALEKIEKLYDEVKTNDDIPQWLKDDILMDYSNLELHKNYCDRNVATESVLQHPYKFIYPEIDKIAESLYEKIFFDIKKSNYVSIYTSFWSDRLISEISRIADVGITALFYGSLTHLRKVRDLLKDILLRLAEKYPYIWFKKQLLRLHLLHSDDNTERIINRYNFIWGHCSQSELSVILMQIFQSKYSDKDVALKSAIQYLGCFLNERDYILLEDKFFEYLNGTMVSHHLFHDVLPLVNFIRPRLNAKRLIEYLQKYYKRDKSMCGYILIPLVEFDLKNINGNEITFIQEVISSYLETDFKNDGTQNRYLDSLLIALGKYHPQLENWLMNKIQAFYPEFLFDYNFHTKLFQQNAESITSDIENMMQIYLSEKNVHINKNFIYYFLIIKKEVSKEIIEKILSILKIELMHEKTLLFEKSLALKILCLIVSRYDFLKNDILDLLSNELIYEGEVNSLFGERATKTTLYAYREIIYLVCNVSNDESAILLKLNYLDDYNKAKVLSLINDCYFFDSKNKIFVGIILQFIINCCIHTNEEVFTIALKKLTSLLNTKFKTTAEPIIIEILREQNYIKRIIILEECSEFEIPRKTLTKIIDICSNDNHFVVQQIVEKLKEKIKHTRKK